MSGTPFKKIKLSPEDVPGAKLPSTNLDEVTAEELMRFLKCRGVKFTSTNKQYLVCTAQDVLDKNLPVDVTVDGGRWLQEKASRSRKGELNVAASSSSDLDIFPVTGWKKFPSIPIPAKFSDRVVADHMKCEVLVENSGDDTSSGEEDVQSYATVKSMARGLKFFTYGHVGKIQDAYSLKNHYCLKAEVQASMKNMKYNVAVMLHASSSAVLDASCHCKASAMSRYSHIYALLAALLDFTRSFGFYPPSCTSQVMTWNQGRKRKSSAPVHERQYTNVLDPSRLSQLTPSARGTEYNQNKLLEITGRVSNVRLWGMIMKHNYEEFDLTAERTEVLQELTSQLQTALLFGACQPQSIAGTELQHCSELWRRVRQVLITASNATKFLSRTASELKKVKELMYEPPSFTNAYVEYGKRNEGNARQSYSAVTGNDVQETGLWVNPKYPGLGASPDGVVVDNVKGRKGILEIKCPYILKDHSPTDLEKLSKTQLSAFYLRQADDGSYELKTSHKYYKQVQMQLGITELEFCDFVVWTPKNIHVERISLDRPHWKATSECLLEYHRQIICPEYFEMRIPRNLPPFELHDSL